MKTFEEKWTAWLDDQLTGKELADFEASLPDRAAAEAEKRDARKLGVLLKRELSPSVLTNEDFFSHQLRERIAREEGSGKRESARSTWWTVPRLVWSGAAAMAVFVLFALIAVPDDEPAEQSQYLTQLMNFRMDAGGNPDATITMFESKDERVTVLWTEGLRSLPSDYAAK